MKKFKYHYPAYEKVYKIIFNKALKLEFPLGENYLVGQVDHICLVKTGPDYSLVIFTRYIEPRSGDPFWVQEQFNTNKAIEKKLRDFIVKYFSWHWLMVVVMPDNTDVGTAIENWKRKKIDILVSIPNPIFEPSQQSLSQDAH